MSNLSVVIDFLITSYKDPQTIVIFDVSNWGVAKGNPAYLQVTPPGFKTPKTLNFVKQSITRLHSVNLGLSCYVEGCGEQEYKDLPDGVWEICLLSSFENLYKKRYFLKTDALRLELDKLYIKANVNYSPDNEIVKALAQIEFLLKVAESYIKRGDHVQAKVAYDEAQQKTEKYKNCKNCY